jgi:ABC-type Fe3+-hydroxamate transport system substrate-binding protein
LLCCAACRTAAGGHGPLVVVDDASDTTRLAAPAVRVASLVPATTELLFALGAGSQIVGRTRWCDWPAEAAAVTDLGDGINPSIEAILAVRPDLVVLYPSARNGSAAERLRSLGIPVVQLRTDTFADLRRITLLLGSATGRADQARQLLAGLDSGLAAVDRRGRPDPPRVLILAWDQPPMTIGQGSFLHEVVELAGGRNLFGELTTPDAPVSLEAIAARGPDLILTTAESPGFARRPEWQVIPAVRERRFLRVSGSEYSRPSPRAPDAIQRLSHALDSLAAGR